MDIVAFAASTSSQSINKKLINWCARRLDAGLLDDAHVKVLDLNDFEMPLYSIDRERHDGLPPAAKELVAIVSNADGIVISLAEHNGSYTAAFKNTFDWMSRVESSFFADRPVVVLATSPGGRGGAGVLEHAVARFPRHGADIRATASVPNFNEHFDEATGQLDDETATTVDAALRTLQTSS